jgi:hypothetical protein
MNDCSLEKSFGGTQLPHSQELSQGMGPNGAF